MFNFFKKSDSKPQDQQPPKAASEFVAACFHEMVETVKKTQGEMSPPEDVKIDLSTEKITLSFAGGKTAEASIQIAGTYDKKDGVFTWSWAKPNVAPSLQKAALLAKKWGEENKHPMFSSQAAAVKPEMVPVLTSVAWKLSGADSTYRAADKDLDVIVLLYGFRWL